MLRPEVCFAPMSELAPELRAGRLSAIDLTEAFLARIATHDARYNAYERVTPELAREQARRAAAELKAGRYRGPLHGVPYAAKDLLDTAGIPTAWGTRFLRDRVPTEDATVVTRLREAGAVLLGKTAMIEFAGCLGYRMGDASATGPGRNPWDPTRWTGGSSSGSGAAVAGGLAAFAIGTETWGSILCPAAFCGLTGLRPTYGVVSRAGGMVGAYTFDKVGPLARSAADCRAVLAAIQGPDPRDPSLAGVTLDLSPARTPPRRALRVAVVPLDWSTSGEPEVRAAFEAAVVALRGMGLALEEAALPEHPASEVAGTLITVEALSTFESFFDDGRVKQLTDRLAARQRELGEPITGADTIKAIRMRRELQVKMAEFFERYDLIVSPNFKSVAPPLSMDLYEALPYGDPVGAISAACGLPGLALPAGTGAARMPCGIQLVAAPFDDAALLTLGERFQQRSSHHRQRPGD